MRPNVWWMVIATLILILGIGAVIQDRPSVDIVNVIHMGSDGGP